MTDSSDSAFDSPQLVMWATLLVGLAVSGYEMVQGEYELAVLIGVAGLVGWAALRLLVQIRTAARE